MGVRFRATFSAITGSGNFYLFTAETNYRPKLLLRRPLMSLITQLFVYIVSDESTYTEMISCFITLYVQKEREDNCLPRDIAHYATCDPLLPNSGWFLATEKAANRWREHRSAI